MRIRYVIDHGNLAIFEVSFSYQCPVCIRGLRNKRINDVNQM